MALIREASRNGKPHYHLPKSEIYIETSDLQRLYTVVKTACRGGSTGGKVYLKGPWGNEYASADRERAKIGYPLKIDRGMSGEDYSFAEARQLAEEIEEIAIREATIRRAFDSLNW